MRGLKKTILLLMGICVIMLFAGCTAPDKVENNLQMDENGKGTFSTKFTLSKAYFEKSKYGMKKSMEEYVAILEKATPTKLGIQYQVDSKSSNEYSYVTTTFAFDSMKDFNKKASAIIQETEKLNVKNSNKVFVDVDKMYDNATKTSIIDNTLLVSLNNEGVSLKTTDKEFTYLRDAMLNRYDNFNAAYVPKSGYEKESVLMEQKKYKDGEYVYMYSVAWSFMESYIYNLVFDNKDMIINNSVLTKDMEQAINKSVSEYFASVCLNAEFKKCIKDTIASSKDDKNALISNVEDLFKGEGAEATGAKIKPYLLKDFENCMNTMNNGLLERKKSGKYELNVKYGDIVIKNLEDYNVDKDSDDTDWRGFKITKSNSTTDKLDDSPKTGDSYSMEIMFSLVVVSIMIYAVCMSLFKQYNK